MMLFLLLVTLFFLIIVFYNGFGTIKARIGSLRYQSKWFFFPDCNNREEDFKKYAKDILDMDDDAIIENMTAELYKLNSIYAVKIKLAGITIKYAQYFAYSAILAYIYIISISTWIQLIYKSLVNY